MLLAEITGNGHFGRQFFQGKKFITPLLRDLDCGMDVYNLESCWKISFWVPTGFIFLGLFSDLLFEANMIG